MIKKYNEMFDNVKINIEKIKMFNELRKILGGFSHLDPSKYELVIKAAYDKIDEYYTTSLYVKKHGHAPSFGIPNNLMLHPFIEKLIDEGNQRGYSFDIKDDKNHKVITLKWVGISG